MSAKRALVIDLARSGDRRFHARLHAVALAVVSAVGVLALVLSI